MQYLARPGLSFFCDPVDLYFGVGLGRFSHIVPCGLVGKGVTSISKLTGHEVGLSEAEPITLAALSESLGRELVRDGELEASYS